MASVFANGYLAPIVVELAGDSLDDLYTQSQAVAEVARSVPGSSISIRSCRSTIPKCASRPSAAKLA